VFAYSRRSHYPNLWSDYPADYSVDLEVHDLVAFAASVGINEPAGLIGSSYGATIAALTGLEHPSVVSSLILCDPTLFSLLVGYPGYEARMKQYDEKVAGPVAEKLRAGDVEGAARIFFGFVVGSEIAYDQLPRESKKVLLDNARTIGSEGNTNPQFSCKDAGSISAPTLLVTGERSSAIYQLIVDELTRCLPNSEKLVIENASHGMYFQNPQAFNSGVLDFLARV
jgi:pimeloyl-ACP methyl ester carboxylesterase